MDDGGGLVGGVGGAGAIAERVLILADDVGYECFGSYGGTSYQTPRIDALAKAGMQFNHCYSQPLCTPSRVKIMTGKSNARNYAAFSILSPDQRTFGHVMRDAGYRTAIAGKWQLYGADHYPSNIQGKGSLPQNAGFERHCLWQINSAKPGRYWNPGATIDGEFKTFEKTDYGPDVYANFLLDRMTEFKDEPFFLYYPMALVHDPFVPTPDAPKGKGNQENFAAMMAYMDKLVGKFVDKTEELGIAKDTLIIFTADNGTHMKIVSQMGDKKVRGGKSKTTDAGTRVPLIAYWPGVVKPGTSTDALVDFSDFLPTIAAATGAKLPDDPLDGVSFLPQLTGKPGPARDAVYVWYAAKKGNGKAVRFARDQDWKLYGDGRFYHVSLDTLEKKRLPIPIEGKAAAAYAKLKAKLDSMPAEGQALLK